MNPFSKIYQNLSDNELIKVISESHKYDPLAIEAAQEEIKNREISEVSQEMIKEQLSRKRNEKTKLDKGLENLQKEFSTISDAVHPIQKQPTRAGSQVIVIAVFSALLSLSSWFKDWYLWHTFIDTKYLGWYVAEPIMNMLLLPVGAFLFYFGKKVGWILLVFFYLRAFLMGVFYIAYMFEMPDAIYYIMSLCFSLVYAVIVWILLKPEIKSIFNVDRNTSKLVTTVSILVSFILLIVTMLDT